MPVYEFRCRSCQRKSSFFVRSMSTPVDAVCQHCGGTAMERAVSTFAYHQSQQSRLEAAGSPGDPSGDFYRDPRNIGRWAEQQWESTMGGEPMPSEIREMIGQAREGEMPKPPPSLPDFGNPLEGL